MFDPIDSRLPLEWIHDFPSRWLIVLISTPLVVLVTVGGLIGAPRTAPQQRPTASSATFQEVAQLIAQAYVENRRHRKGHGRRDARPGRRARSVQRVPHAGRSARRSRRDGAQPPADVGLVVTRQFYLRVLGVRDGSPAAKAGLQTGDYVRMIDGRPTRDMSAFTGTRLLRGAPGTKVVADGDSRQHRRSARHRADARDAARPSRPRSSRCPAASPTCASPASVRAPRRRSKKIFDGAGGAEARRAR